MRFLPIIALSMIGCYAPTVPAGGACSTACPGGQVCVAGTCRAPGDDEPLPDGSPILDTDGDGRFDDVDNCVARANVDQHDEDLDGAGDACDPCPHLAASGVAAYVDGDGDGVGDACDPEPDTKRQQWAYFDPFVERRTEWSRSDAATFGVDQMKLVRGYITLNVPNGELRIVAGGELSELGPVPRQHVIELGRHPDGTYYYAEAYQEQAAAYLMVTKFDGTNYLPIDGADFAGPLPTGRFAWTLDESVATQTIAFSAAHAGTATLKIAGPTEAPKLAASGYISFGTKSVTVTYDYVAVIRTMR